MTKFRVRSIALLASFATTIVAAGPSWAEGPGGTDEKSAAPYAATPEAPPAALPDATVAKTDTKPAAPAAGGWVPPPEWRFVLNDLFVFRWNQLGIENQTRLGVQKRLFHKDSSALLRDNFFFFGIYPKINPAYVKIGPSIEIQPASIFNLRLAAEYMEFFKTFGYLQSFQSPVEDYSDTTMANRRQDDKNYRTGGLHAMIEPTIQFRFDIGHNLDGTAKYGWLAIRNKFAAEYWMMGTHPTDDTNPTRIDPVWYDATLDTLVPAKGWVIQNDLDVIYMTKKRLNIGVRYTVVRPFYDRSAFRSDEEYNKYHNDNGHQRIGPVLTYTFSDTGYSKFSKPTVLVICNWYITHRWRTGADESQAMPYLLAGFTFSSDFLQ